jgi:hypothetical protein
MDGTERMNLSRTILAVAILLAACADAVVGFDYRVASKDPKVTSAQMLTIVNRALDRPEASASASVSAWAKVDEKTGEVTFGLGAVGSGKTVSIRNTEARLLKELRDEFGDRVEVFCNGEPLR